MGEGSKREFEWYIASQQPGATHPLWRLGVGPTAATVPGQDRVVLLRDGSDRFFAGWLREGQLPGLSAPLRERLNRRSTSVAALSQEQADELLAALGHAADAGGPPEPEPIEVFPPVSGPGAGEAETAHEGQPVLVQHVRRERSRRLRRKKIEGAAAGGLRCEACGFDFSAAYGTRGAGFIECHHLIPVSELDPATPTSLDDLALLCANCHRMVHVRRPWLDVEGLKALLDA
jgi:hypothetical protein